MLIDFSCSNYRSIKDSVYFSMLAGTDNSFSDTLAEYEDHRFLRSAAIYGANGSGKSNFIKAVSFMKRLVLNSIANQPGEGISQNPHKLSGIQSDSEYTIQFVKNGIRYAYGFTILNALVKEEYLYYFPNKRKVLIFKREEASFIEGSKFKGKFDVCKDILKPNKLMLSCAANFSSVEPIDEAYTFFRDDLVIYFGLGTGNWMNYSLRKIHESENIKELILSFLQMLGTGINDIQIDIKKQALREENLPSFLSDEFKADLIKASAGQITATVVYDSFDVDLLRSESSGIKKLVEFLCPFIDIIISGKVLICDELEINFHESLLHELIKFFNDPKLYTKAQLIFTTHDTSLLDLKLFRRDQIWFTELVGEERATDLYSLIEMKNVRKDENIEKGYIQGKYGAIPMLNENLADLVNGILED